MFIKDYATSEYLPRSEAVVDASDPQQHFAHTKRNSLTKIIDFGKQMVSPRPMTSLQDRAHSKAFGLEEEFKLIGGSLVEARSTQLGFQPFESHQSKPEFYNLDDYIQSSSSQGKKRIVYF